MNKTPGDIWFRHNIVNQVGVIRTLLSAPLGRICIETSRFTDWQIAIQNEMDLITEELRNSYFTFIECLRDSSKRNEMIKETKLRLILPFTVRPHGPER